MPTFRRVYAVHFSESSHGKARSENRDHTLIHSKGHWSFADQLCFVYSGLDGVYRHKWCPFFV